MNADFKKNENPVKFYVTPPVKRNSFVMRIASSGKTRPLDIKNAVFMKKAVCRKGKSNV